MFSQLRNVVEQLAGQQEGVPNNSPSNSPEIFNNGQPPRTSSPSGSIGEGRRSGSFTTNQLADSALLNLRKSLKTSRSSSPYPPSLPEREHTRLHRSLEERLRASFTVGEASSKTTPATSKPQSPSEVDPASIALPVSPTLEYEEEQSGASNYDPGQVQLLSTPSQHAFPSPLDHFIMELENSESHAEVSPSAERPVLSSSQAIDNSVSSGSDDVQDIDQTKQQDETNHEKDTWVEAEQNVQTFANDSQSEHNANSYYLESNHGGQKNHTAIGKLDKLGQDMKSSIGQAKSTDIADVVSSDVQYIEPSSPLDLERNVSHSSPTVKEQEVDVVKLQERLKLVEQRFTDVSTTFKRLQAEKCAADNLLKELTAVETISDVDGLRNHLTNLKLKEEISVEEIKRLNSVTQLHDQYLQELRETHRLESSSRCAQTEQLRQELVEAESRLKSSEAAFTNSKYEAERLRADLGKAKGVSKEEEEKRTKAISLLKTVRAKLVKVEKEKEDAVKEVLIERDREKEEKDKEKLERLRVETELERFNLEKDKELANIRAQFDKELASIREKYEKENAARKGQYELEAITTKAAHSKELASKASRIAVLESNIRTLSEEKDVLFDQLQLRQAELESSQSHLDSIEAQSNELQYQLRDAESRIELQAEELIELKTKASGFSSHTSAKDLARVLAETEGKHESRISELRQRMRALEKERQEAEDEWSRNLQERNRELERMRGIIDNKDKEYADFIQTKNVMEDAIEDLKADNRKLMLQREAEEGVLHGLQKDIQWLKDSEMSLKLERDELTGQVRVLQKQFEGVRERESASKIANKSLREELHKVQSSAALLERQRNPGIGYWSTSPRHNAFTQSAVELQTTTQLEPGASINDTLGHNMMQASTSASAQSIKKEEEINLEYIRNVILQFLEHKEMRPNLIRVLSIILHFTPQETRRLIAKM